MELAKKYRYLEFVPMDSINSNRIGLDLKLPSKVNRNHCTIAQHNVEGLLDLGRISVLLITSHDQGEISSIRNKVPAYQVKLFPSGVGGWRYGEINVNISEMIQRISMGNGDITHFGNWTNPLDEVIKGGLRALASEHFLSAYYVIPPHLMLSFLQLQLLTRRNRLISNL